MKSIKCVYRQFALPISSFDYLKNYQRSLERQGREKLTNSEALARLIAEHAKLSTKGDHDE